MGIAVPADHACFGLSHPNAKLAPKERWADLMESESESETWSRDALPVANRLRADDAKVHTSVSAGPRVLGESEALARGPRVLVAKTNSVRPTSGLPVRPSGRQNGSRRGFTQDAAKGSGLCKAQGKGGNGRKYQCQFQIQIEEEPNFRVVRCVLGSAGANVKAIAEDTGARLRLRGRGSKFLEGPEQVESSDQLMLCLSVTGRGQFEAAKQSVTRLLERVYVDYDMFRKARGEVVAGLVVQMHTGTREGC